MKVKIYTILLIKTKGELLLPALFHYLVVAVVDAAVAVVIVDVVAGFVVANMEIYFDDVKWVVVVDVYLNNVYLMVM